MRTNSKSKFRSRSQGMLELGVLPWPIQFNQTYFVAGHLSVCECIFWRSHPSSELILARCQRYRRVRTAAHTLRSSHYQLDKSSIWTRKYCLASDCGISLTGKRIMERYEALVSYISSRALQPRPRRQWLSCRQDGAISG
jgi:hypothetical protein